MPRKVRGADEIRRAEQRVILGRGVRFRKHVKRRAGDLTAFRGNPSMPASIQSSFPLGRN